MPAALIAPIALGGVSACYLGWRLEPAYVLCGGLVASVFSGYWGTFGLPNSLAPDRLLLTAAIGMALVRSPAARDRPSFQLQTCHLGLVAVTLYVVGSAAWAGTLSDSAAMFRLVDRLGIVPFALFTVTPLIIYRERHRRALIATLVGLGLYLGATALFETLGVTSLVFPSYINDPSLGNHAGRARGPFLEAESEGMALFICGVAAVIALQQKHRYGRRALAVAVLALSAAGILFTLERAVWVASIAGVAIVLWRLPQLRRIAVPVGVAGALGLVGVVAAIPGLSDKLTARTDSLRANRSVWDRKNLNAAAIRLVAAYPAVGVGWDRFQERVEPFFRSSPDYPLTGSINGRIQIVHNVFLSNAAELGLIGTAIWVLAMAGCFVPLMRRRGPPAMGLWQAGFAAILCMWVVVACLTPLQKPFPNIILWVWAGALASRRWADDGPRALGESRVGATRRPSKLRASR